VEYSDDASLCPLLIRTVYLPLRAMGGLLLSHWIRKYANVDLQIDFLKVALSFLKRLDQFNLPS
jgi:hypothetical protein